MDDPRSIVSVTNPSHGGAWPFPYFPYAQYLRMHEGTTLATVEASLGERARFGSTAAGDARIQPTTSIVQERVDAFLGRKRMLALLAGPTAALALVLSALGVYGVTTFVVSHRTREVSVRMALGTSTGAVLRLLIKDSLRPVVIGLVVGLVLALGVGRVLARELSGISPHDPLAIGLAAVTLLTVALVAVVVPARRVARTDPASALQQS